MDDWLCHCWVCLLRPHFEKSSQEIFRRLRKKEGMSSRIFLTHKLELTWFKNMMMMRTIMIYQWVASLLVRSSTAGSSPGRGYCVVFLVKILYRLTVPLSTRVYKWFLATQMLGVTLQWTSDFMLQKPREAFGLMDHLACMQTNWVSDTYTCDDQTIFIEKRSPAHELFVWSWRREPYSLNLIQFWLLLDAFCHWQ